VNLPAVVLPEYESVTLQKPNDYGGWDHREHMPIQPFQRDPSQTIRQHNIKIPFQTIITMDKGHSVCSTCGARYAGYQKYCTNKVWMYKHDGDWHWSHGNAVKYSQYKGRNDSWPKVVKQSEMRVCDTVTTWDLMKEFNDQKAFFEFVEIMSYLPAETSCTIIKYANALPPGSAHEYRIISLEQQLNNCRYELDRHRMALEQIVQRMNTAGAALSF
jgi:hypothetical protein